MSPLLAPHPLPSLLLPQPEASETKLTGTTTTSRSKALRSTKSPFWNALNLGATQQLVYTLVYNDQRTGMFRLDGRLNRERLTQMAEEYGSLLARQRVALAQRTV